MKSREKFNKEVFEKYQDYNLRKNKANKSDYNYYKFFNSHVYKKDRIDILKNVAIFLICIAVSISAVNAGIKAYNKYVDIKPTYTQKLGNTDMNSIWIGSFQIAWNEFMEQIVGGNVEFESGNFDLLNELNKKSFTKDMLRTNDYYIKIGKTTPELKNIILKDIKNKFCLNILSALDNINFDFYENVKSYTIYSMIYKKYTFLNPFDNLGYEVFGKREDNTFVKYFGNTAGSSSAIYDNVDVLFYNNSMDFAVKIKTKENDELILYKTDKNDSFDNIYNQIKDKTSNYSGNTKFVKGDELKIPYISVDQIINYDELCGKEIKGTNGMYIASAIQNVKFNLNESGGNLVSEALVVNRYKNIADRDFSFNDKFVLFLKEKDKEKPYFALKVDNTDILIRKAN